ncbi:MAG: primosomal protein N' [Ruminococcaceae bacterium]|nr:primosomal protein N' [Oscillospiraceae bacterium]
MRTDNSFIASVAVEGTVYHFDKLFDYAVSEDMAQRLLPGCRVSVPFAKGNQSRQGMVMEVKRGNSTGLKYVLSVLDDEPVLTPDMITLADYMHRHLYCTYFEAVKAMLPAGLNFNIKTVYSAVPQKDKESLSEEENRIYEYLLSVKAPKKREDLMSAFGYSDFTLFEKLVEKGYLLKSDDAFRKIGDKSVRMLRLCADAFEYSGKLTEKQRSVLDLLCDVGEASVKELCYYTGVTQAVVDALVKKGIAEYFDIQVYRTPETENAEKVEFPVLNLEQNNAFEGLLEKTREDKASVALLYGVTGSGKTAVFLKLIKSVTDRGKGVIVMVPEIALTPQLVKRFKELFGDDVAIFHSGLSVGERLDEFRRVQKGLVKIAVGTRSAVFAPFKNLGLIIMDEEQEHTYKSENKPRFHARDIAKFRCNSNKCLLLLSSATPDVESYYFANSGRYSLFKLPNRFGNAELPEVLTVDMNEELLAGNNTGISSALLSAIEENLNIKKQSILLLNRRGYNTFAVCRSCKEVVNCPNCSISLTYHNANNRLMCHYCGYSQPVSQECPSCHEESLHFSGTGTQKAQELLEELFPDAKILRMDADSVMQKNAHEKLLSAFSKGEYDILIGTQMVAKGLDFPNVTLVGVLSADQVLYSDDYRSFERAFSMLTQVLGRSGRGECKGRAIIQTYTPENAIIELSSMQDYDAFYRDEIEIRKALTYPPFSDILVVGFLGENKANTITCAKAFLARLKELCAGEYKDLPIRTLGPSAALVSKVNNKYRYRIIIKSRNTALFRSLISDLLKEFGKDKKYRDVTVYADLKPLSF